MDETDNMPFVTADAGIPLRRRTWATVIDGRIVELKTILAHLAHPFPEHEERGGRVVEFTGVDVRPGYLVDAKGNATPPEGRAGTLPVELPAYHEGPGRPESAANKQAEIAGNAPVTDSEPVVTSDQAGGDPTAKPDHAEA